MRQVCARSGKVCARSGKVYARSGKVYARSGKVCARSCKVYAAAAAIGLLTVIAAAATVKASVLGEHRTHITADRAHGTEQLLLSLMMSMMRQCLVRWEGGATPPQATATATLV